MTDVIREGMAMDDFIKAINDQPFELINGERIDKMPNVAGHTMMIRLFRRLIEAFVDGLGLGYVFAESTYVLREKYDSNWVKGSRIPDVAYYEKDRLDAYMSEVEDWDQKPFLLVPDLVVEVLSPNDSYTAVDEKVDAYRQDGVRLIWLVDPARKKVTVHRLVNIQPEIKTRDTTLSGETVLPDFSVPLSEVFEGDAS